MPFLYRQEIKTERISQQMKVLTKKNIKKTTTEYIPMIFGLRIPEFIRIHFRYAIRSPLIWCVLFLAPFIICIIALSLISETLLETPAKGWHLFFIALFLVALAFFLAERSRRFRWFYVIAIPAMVIANGLITLFFKSGLSFGSYIVFGILSVVPALLLGKFSMGKGYQLLSDGADKNYRPGYDLYMDEDYEAAFVHLDASAKRGHMKSLYLLGHAHEYGNGKETDLIRALRFYAKSSSKGYRKATEAYDRLVLTFTPEQLESYETDMSEFEIRQLF